jgi:hypothetical protein
MLNFYPKYLHTYQQLFMSKSKVLSLLKGFRLLRPDDPDDCFGQHCLRHLFFFVLLVLFNDVRYRFFSIKSKYSKVFLNIFVRGVVEVIINGFR